LRYVIDLKGPEHVGSGLDYVFDTAELDAYVQVNPAGSVDERHGYGVEPEVRSCPTISRRALLTCAMLGGASLLTKRSLAGTNRNAATNATNRPIIRTAAGKVSGSVDEGVSIFMGIPYGASTAGANRFLPPQKAVRWAGVRPASTYAPMAVQIPVTDRTYLELLHGLYPILPYPMSEDCLFLNVWSPELGSECRRPVMVWLHPGGYSIGAGNSPWSDGKNLARSRDVVVVSLNHRLNAFGHLYLGHVGGAAYAESGNVAMLDILSALEWVQENIAQFGGDPSNVTIFGESGGAGKVSILMAMPQGRGLFHKAIVQSGSRIRVKTVEEAELTTDRVLQRLQIRPDNLGDLQHLATKRILTAMGEEYFTSVVAGDALPRQPFEPDAPASSAQVSMLIGTNKDDGVYCAVSERPPRVEDWASLRAALVRSFHITDFEAGQYLEAYRSTHQSDATPSSLFEVATEGYFWDRAITQAERKAALGKAPVYMYRFDWVSPAFGGKYGSCHTFEVPFVFDNLDAAPQLWGVKPDSSRYGLAENVSKAWSAFAHSGNPSHPGIPSWKPYSAAERTTMVLNYSCTIEIDPHREVRLAFERMRPTG
jgi:para-nitrobenzyl esterase